MNYLLALSLICLGVCIGIMLAMLEDWWTQHKAVRTWKKNKKELQDRICKTLLNELCERCRPSGRCGLLGEHGCPHLTPCQEDHALRDWCHLFVKHPARKQR